MKASILPSAAGQSSFASGHTRAKHRSRAALAAIAVATLSASTASATSLIYEPFNYTSGQALLGQRNTSTGTTAGTAVQADTSVGNLWLRAAPAASPATTVNIASGSLTAPTGLLASSGNDLNINGIGAYTTQRPADRLAFRADTTTGSNVTSGTVFYSFLLRVDALTGANNVGGDYFVSLNNTANAATTADPTVHPGEMRARVDPTDSSKFSLGMFTQHASVTQGDAAWVNGLNVSDTYFVVGAFNIGGSNTARLWINPSSDFYGAATAPTPTAQDTVSGTNGTTIGSLLLHQRTAPWLTMDELRVATTWGEVTPAVLLPVDNGLFWDIDGATAGSGGTTPSGTWDGATANWSTAPYGDAAAQAWTADKVAVFSAGNDASGSYTITVSGTQSANGLAFQDGAATLSGGEVDLTGGASVDVALNRTATINSVVGGSSGLTKTGLGAVVLGGNNTYTGGTTINSGMVHLLTTTAMPATGTVTVNSGATLSVRAGGASEWTDSTDTATGGTLGSLIAGRGGQGAADQVVWKDGSTLGVSTLNAAGGSLTYSGVIGGFHTDTGTTNKVGLLKRGGGTTLVLTGNNTFSGPLSVDSDGGIVALSGTNANAGQSFADFGQTVPTVSIGNAGGDNTITNGSRDSGIKILADNALPTNSLISFGSSIGGNDTPSSLLQLYDGFATIGTLPSGASFNQTIRGVTGGSGRIKTGLGTLTIDVPTGESYVSGGTLRTDYQDATNHGKIIKTGAGRQDFNQANGNFNGDFILQNGTLGVGTANVFGVSGSATNRLILNGGTLMNVGTTSVTMSVKRVEFGGSFTVDPVANSNFQFQDATFTLTTPNPTITVLPGTGGQFIAWGKITDNGAGYGFTKAGAGTLNLTPSGIAGANDYSGATTIQAGALRVIEFSQIGNGSSDVNLSGGQLEYNGAGATDARLFNVTNRLHVTADSTIAYNSTTAGLTDVTDPTGIQFVFSNNTFDRTGGTLTLVHKGTSQGITFRPRFSGSGFDYTGPVVISNGGGTRKTVLESTNTTGTQTWSGDITGDGSYSRGTGGTTVFGGQLVSIGGVAVANNSTLQLAQSPGSNRVIRTASLTIGGTDSRLDLTNNKLIVPAGDIGTATAGTYGGLSGQIQSAYDFGAWDGPGLTTTMPDAAAGLTTIAIATGEQVRGLGPTDTDTFAGQTINGASVIAMYTYAGDANLDGTIDGGDYGIIDNFVQVPGAFGYANGDFNYDGVIDGGDYGIIDNNIQAQGAPFPTSGVSAPIASELIGGVQAVPEPAAAVSAILAAAFGSRRRRSRR